MGILVWSQNYHCVTQTLNLKYLRPIPLKVNGYIVTEIMSVTEKTVSVESTICDEVDTAFVKATAVFHRLSPEQLDRFFIKNSRE